MPINQPKGDGTGSTHRASRLETDVGSQLRYLVRSMEPAIVFSSLAHLCVPAFSEKCTVDIVENGEIAYRISYPRSDLDNGPSSGKGPTGQRLMPADHEYAVRTRFASSGYTGMMTHSWRTRAPTPGEVSRALALVRHGVDTIWEERQQGHHPHHGHDDKRPYAVLPAPAAGTLDPAVAALLQARAQRLRHWARCETQHIARG